MRYGSWRLPLVLLGSSSGGESVSSHVEGKPMSVRTHAGFSRPPVAPGIALGVEKSGPRCPTTASVSVVPECRPLSVEYPAAPLAFASVAVAVGQSDRPSSSATTSFSGRLLSPCLLLADDFHSRAELVGHNEHPESSMGRADVDGAERYGPGSITSIPKLLHHARKPALGPARDVLDDDDARTRFSDDPLEVVPRESAARFLPEPGSFSGRADVGAHEASAEEVDGGGHVDGRDIGEPFDVGKVLRENAPAEGIDLTLPGDLRRDPGFRERGKDT